VWVVPAMVGSAKYSCGNRFGQFDPSLEERQEDNMKKLYWLIAFAILMALVPAHYALAGGALKLGLDFSGDHEFSYSGDSENFDVETGLSFAGEFYAALNRNVDLGAGIILQMPRSLEDYTGTFNFIPLYGVMRLKLDNQGATPYFIGQLGYSLFFGDSDYKGSADLEGGLYYGIGGGVIINQNILIELLYAVSRGTYGLDGVDFDVDYYYITLNLGINF
jgi:hypothetical protein